MDEIQLVRDLFGEPPPPDPKVVAAAKARISAREPGVRRRFAGLSQAPWRDVVTRGRGRRWTGWFAPLAAAAAMTVVIAVLVVARGAPSGTGSALSPAAGRPDIYVTVTAQYLHPPQASSDHRLVPVPVGEITVGTATIRDASTGDALASVQLWPRQPEHPRGPAVKGFLVGVEIAAAADNRTFAISDLGVTDQGGLYLLHVAASGRAARLDRINMTFPSGLLDFDLSPDAAKLALSVQHCPGNGRPCVNGMEIITLATGTARTWLYSTPDTQALDSSWTDNGKAVTFLWGSKGVFGYRTLSDTAPQGDLTAESVPFSYPPAGPQGFPTPWVETPTVLTPDGRSLLVVTETIVPGSRSSGSIFFRITDEAPRTGRMLRVLRVFQTHYQGNPYLSTTACNIVSLAPAGLHALVECPQFGRLDGSTFTPLPTGPAGLPNAPTLGAAW